MTGKKASHTSGSHHAQRRRLHRCAPVTPPGPPHQREDTVPPPRNDSHGSNHATARTTARSAHPAGVSSSKNKVATPVVIVTIGISGRTCADQTARRRGHTQRQVQTGESRSSRAQYHGPCHPVVSPSSTPTSKSSGVASETAVKRDNTSFAMPSHSHDRSGRHRTEPT